jgi:hypothetical protein
MSLLAMLLASPFTPHPDDVEKPSFALPQDVEREGEEV